MSSRYGEVIDHLKEALRLERQLIDLYKGAGDRSKDLHVGRTLQGIAERHASQSERLHHLIERLEREGGEGMFAEMMQSLGHAISGMLSMIPVMVVEAETDATFDTLGRYEGTLIGYYEALEPTLDDEGKRLVMSFIENCRHHMEKLVELDPFS
jgi:hypothetical protein